MSSSADSRACARPEASRLSPVARRPDPGYPSWRARPWGLRLRLVHVGAAASASAAILISGCGAAPTRAAPSGPTPVVMAASVARASDRDADGIVDSDDQCELAAEDLDRFEDDDGCPDHDNDLDRFADAVDRCPTDPETYNGVEDEDGCPDRTAGVILEPARIVLLDRVHFTAGSAEIMAVSFPVLDAVAATLTGNPQIELTEVAAHADERGSDAYNLRMTRARAQAVVEYLAARGVERTRLRAFGYGERCPVDPEHDEAAWERNRRVEFRILRTSGGPNDEDVACEAARDLSQQQP